MAADVFVVEDSRVYCAAFRQVLNGQRFSYEVFSDGAEAWRALEQAAPKVLLLDWNLPGMDGIELCRKCREQKGRPYLFVIMLTTNDRIEDVVAGFEAGADEYLTKPFQNAVLLAKIKVGFRICDLEQQLAHRMEQVAQVNAEQQGLIASLQDKNRIISRQADEIRSAQQRLIETARMAGMAEIATSVLHNVGNLLNTSVTAAAIMRESLASSKMSTLGRLSTLLQQHREDFGRFITQDSRGGKLPEFLQQIHGALSQEQDLLREKLSTLSESTEQIRQIIALQHRYIGAAGIRDKVSLQNLIQDATRLSLESLKRHNVNVVHELADDIPEVCVEKHKVLQILMNLLKNALDATKSMGECQREVRVRLTAGAESMARIDITDNGQGIKPENLDRIFNFGFTTKPDGHGFGLHSCANMAREMGGALTVTSAGEGHGASFSLTLPLSLD